MSPRRTQPRARAQALVAAVLLVVNLAAPVLAGMPTCGLACGQENGGSVVRPCCCAPAPAEALVASCCAPVRQRAAGTQRAPGSERGGCKCALGDDPGAPPLPLDRSSEGVGSRSIANLALSQALRSARTPAAPWVSATQAVRCGAGSGAAPPPPDPETAGARVAGRVLVARGVSGLLAVLSVARL